MSHKCNLLRRTLQMKQQASEAVIRRLQFLKTYLTSQEKIFKERRLQDQQMVAGIITVISVWSYGHFKYC